MTVIRYVFILSIQSYKNKKLNNTNTDTNNNNTDNNNNNTNNHKKN